MKTYQIIFLDNWWQLREVGSTEPSEQKWKTLPEAVKACADALNEVATEADPITLQICDHNNKVIAEYAFPGGKIIGGNDRRRKV